MIDYLEYKEFVKLFRLNRICAIMRFEFEILIKIT